MDENAHAITTFVGRKLGDWLWCLHCTRVYQAGEYRLTSDGYLQYCPYEDCNGDTVMDASKWENVRKHRPEYPEVPERDTRYPAN